MYSIEVELGIKKSNKKKNNLHSFWCPYGSAAPLAFAYSFAEFVSLSEIIWKNVALYLLLTNGSSAVNGCRQIESPNSW